MTSSDRTIFRAAAAGVTELCPHPALLIDADGAIVAANRLAGELCGIPSLAGCAVESLVVARERDRLAALCRQRGGEARPLPASAGASPLFTLDGNRGEISVEIGVGEAGTFADGSALRLVTLIDCTERNAIADELRRREEFYRTLFNKAPQAYQSLDIEGNFVDVNDAWLKMFGVRSKEPVIGQFFGDFMAESSKQLMGVTFAKFKVEGYVSSPVFEARRRDNGQAFLIQVHGRIDRDAAGNFVRTHCLLSDVSERVRVEKEILRLNAELEARVRARTNEFLIAKAEAESANAVKTRFMLNVSHEMRTPLNAILGMAQAGLMRLKRGDVERLHGVFAAQLDSGNRLKSLIESLLQLTEDAWKQHSKIPDDELHEVDLVDLARDALSITEELSAEKRQGVTLEAAGEPCTTRCSPTLIVQVLTHLLENAIRYSPRGSQIIVRIGDESEPVLPGMAAVSPGYRLIEIIDEGCGVPEGELEAIFEPFYQSSRTHDGAGGTGLGLTLCRSIVMKHKGRLSAHNRSTGGTVFRLRLPRG